MRKKFSRKQLLHFTANLQVELIGMEACGGSHFLGRALREQGHEVRLMPAQYVKPYVKTNKSDYIDAEAIAEAVGRPRMRFGPIKTDDQLDLQSLHWKPNGQHFEPSRCPYRGAWFNPRLAKANCIQPGPGGRFLQSPSLVTTSTAGLLCFLRISPSRNRSVRSARRWMEAFRLSINWELIAG